jgi:hypothetical protein
MVESELPFGPRTARRLMAVGRDERLSKRTHVSVLPASWGTLYALTKLSDKEFEAGVADGTINPSLERKTATGRATRLLNTTAAAASVSAIAGAAASKISLRTWGVSRHRCSRSIASTVTATMTPATVDGPLNPSSPVISGPERGGPRHDCPPSRIC